MAMTIEPSSRILSVTIMEIPGKREPDHAPCGSQAFP